MCCAKKLPFVCPTYFNTFFICTIIFSNLHAICLIDFTSKLAPFIWDLSKSSNYKILSIALQQSLFRLIVWHSEYSGNCLFKDFKKSHITSHYLPTAAASLWNAELVLSVSVSVCVLVPICMGLFALHLSSN